MKESVSSRKPTAQATPAAAATAASIGPRGNDTGAVSDLSWGCCARRRHHGLGLVGLLLVLGENLQGLVDLGRESLRRLEEVEKLSVVHLEEHTWGHDKSGARDQSPVQGVGGGVVNRTVPGVVPRTYVADSTSFKDTTLHDLTRK